jgi:hypothetical protein
VVELTNVGFEGMDYMRHDGLQMASMKAGIDGQRLTEVRTWISSSKGYSGDMYLKLQFDGPQ